ncbi:hypothetical protein BHE74_00005100 [Ensete ventricosum]|nr:hypothetical protein BHE74_00005100 [Ensete ventricosum]
MTQWELTESSPEVSRGSNDVVESSPRTHQKFVGKFVGGSPEEYWKFIGSSPKDIGSSPGVHRKDVGSLLKRQSDNED